MNRTELDAAVTAADAWNRFDLRSVAAPQNQGSDKTVLEPAVDDSGRWVVYYSERGRINDPVYFDTEDAACDFVHARIAPRRPPPGPPMTAEQSASAAVQKAKAEAAGRQMLIDAGYDPDTLKLRPS